MPAIEQPLPFATLIELARYRAATHPRRKAFTFLRNGADARRASRLRQLDVQARRIAARLQQAFQARRPRAARLCVRARIHPGALRLPVCRRRRRPGASTVVFDGGGTPEADRRRIGRGGPVQRHGGIQHGHLGLSAPRLHKHLRCITTTDDADAPPPEAWTEPDVGPDSLALLLHTSGSTGPSRGVMVSHARVLHNQRLIQQALHSSPRTRSLSWLAPHHDMGLMAHVMQPLYLGITSVLMSSAAFIAKPVRWLQALTDQAPPSAAAPTSPTSCASAASRAIRCARST